jgi:hypothetical protein
MLLLCCAITLDIGTVPGTRPWDWKSHKGKILPTITGESGTGIELQLNKFVGCKREEIDVDLVHEPRWASDAGQRCAQSQHAEREAWSITF